MSISVNPGSSTAVEGTIEQSVINENPSYDFYWDMEQRASNWPLWGYGSGDTEYGSGGGELSTNYAHGGTRSLRILNAGFSDANWYNNSNARIFASIEQGTLTFWWLYPSTFTTARMLTQITGKSIVAEAVSTDDSISIRTTTVGGGASPAIQAIWNTDGGTDLTLAGSMIATPTAEVWMKVTCAWNKNSKYTFMVQVDDEPPSYSTAAYGPVKAAQFHLCLIGNDLASAYEFYLDDYTISQQWVYTLPCSVWQDFEFDTLSQANLEANDHANGPNARTWGSAGTVTRFTTNTNGEYRNPSTINNISDTGTRGYRNDLNSTDLGSWQVLLAAGTTSQRSFGMWVKTAAIASGTSARFGGAAGSTTNVVALDQRNTAGQHELIIVGASTSSAVNVSADTWYWVSILAHRSNTCSLAVFDTTGTQVGTTVTCTGVGTSIDRFYLGSLVTTTSQTSGLYHYIDDFVLVNATPQTGEFPIIPWPTQS